MTGGEGSLLTGVQAFDVLSSMVATTDERLVMHLPTDLYFVPMPAHVSASAIGLSASGVLNASALVKALAAVYDGDTITLNGVRSIAVAMAPITMRAGVILQGNTQRQASPGVRRSLLQAATDNVKARAVLLPARRRLAQASLRTVAESQTSGVMAGTTRDALLAGYKALWSDAFTVVDCHGGINSSAFLFTGGNSTLTNLIVTNCSGTAVVLMGTANITFSSVIFVGNTGVKGGALRVEAGARAIIDNCVFLNNTAVNGSAVYVAATGIMSIHGSSFHGNGQGAAARNGGAVFIDKDAEADFITDSLFYHNGRSSDGDGTNVLLVSCVAVRGCCYLLPYISRAQRQYSPSACFYRAVRCMYRFP